MTRMFRGSIVPMLFVLGALGGFVLHAGAQHAGHGASAPVSPGLRRFTMEELHRSGGVPRGWKFTLPAGDPAKGRRAFADLECYTCHAIQGERFPASGGDAKSVGPELTGMGTHHPAEYFAESILAPNAVILDGPGYVGPDGTSTTNQSPASHPMLLRRDMDQDRELTLLHDASGTAAKIPGANHLTPEGRGLRA